MVWVVQFSLQLVLSHNLPFCLHLSHQIKFGLAAFVSKCRLYRGLQMRKVFDRYFVVFQRIFNILVHFCARFDIADQHSGKL